MVRPVDRLLWGLASSVVLLGAQPAAAQFPPQELKNIKVLPKEMTPREVVDMMRGFAGGLGVRCTYCHVGEEGQPISSYDFASDDKVTKERARVMIRMVQAINQDHIAKLPGDHGNHVEDHVVVGCETCHRGQPIPYTLEQRLQLALDASGPDSAVALYRKLRDEYYGRATYDFSENRLVGLGAGLIAAKKVDAAIAILNLNLEFHPQSSPTVMVLGDAFAAQGDKEKAATYYRWALVLNPRNQAAQGRLTRLGN